MARAGNGRQSSFSGTRDTLKLSRAEIENLLHLVKFARRSSVVNEWERTFLITVTARMNGGAFWPSHKQLPILARIIDKFKAASLTDDAQIIEGDDAHE